MSDSICTADNIGKVVNGKIESSSNTTTDRSSKGDMVGCPGEMVGWTNTTKATLVVTFDSKAAIKENPLTIPPNETRQVTFLASGKEDEYEYTAMLGSTEVQGPSDTDSDKAPIIRRPRIRVVRSAIPGSS